MATICGLSTCEATPVEALQTLSRGADGSPVWRSLGAAATRPEQNLDRQGRTSWCLGQRRL